jgi:hypothetical protein
MIENRADRYIKPDIRPVVGIIRRKDGSIKPVYPVSGACMVVGMHVEIPGVIIYEDGKFLWDCHNPNCPTSTRNSTDLADPEHPSSFAKEEQSPIYKQPTTLRSGF